MALVNGKAYVETLCMPCDSHVITSRGVAMCKGGPMAPPPPLTFLKKYIIILMFLKFSLQK